MRSLLIGMSPEHSRAVLVAMNLRDRRWFDVYRIDLESGDTRMVNRNGGAQTWWAADDELNVRVAAAFAGTIVRDGPGRRWRVARRWHPGELSRYIGLSADGRSFLMTGAHNGEASALLAVNLDTGEETAIVTDPEYDIEDVFVHPLTRELQAAAIYREKLEWEVLDQSVADDFAAQVVLRSGEMTVLNPPYESPIIFSGSLGRRDLSDRFWIVSYANDDSPIHHYLYDRTSKASTLLFSEQPGLEAFTLAKMKPISYLSRDGLKIHGYLTLPAGVPAKSLPTVLYVHGGPHQRDRWGYYNTIQWLANRGYAVLQVNFRGSSGYGRKFVHAGYKEWGGKMHDDLIDGVDWLIKEGIADPRKVAIAGASYGGYSALAGLALTPEKFIAGLSSVGISHLIAHHDNYPPYWPRRRFQTRVGDPQKDQALLNSRSPLNHATSIKAPLLIVHGAHDVRVTAMQSEQMVAAMRAAGKPVEYILYQDEGHRQWRPENKIHFFAAAEEFLARHLGGRLEPAAEIPGHAALIK